MRADIPVPMVASSDIALKAAEFLHALNFKGHSIFEFIGPQEITMTEAAKIIGKAIGKPALPYRQLTPQESEKGMSEAGMSPNVIKLLVEMYQTMNDEKIQFTQQMTPEHKGKTTIEEFALKTFAPEVMAAKH